MRCQGSPYLRIQPAVFPSDVFSHPSRFRSLFLLFIYMSKDIWDVGWSLHHSCFDHDSCFCFIFLAPISFHVVPFHLMFADFGWCSLLLFHSDFPILAAPDYPRHGWRIDEHVTVRRGTDKNSKCIARAARKRKKSTILTPMWLKWSKVARYWKMGKGEHGVHRWQRGSGNGIEASNCGESRRHRSLMQSWTQGKIAKHWLSQSKPICLIVFIIATIAKLDQYNINNISAPPLQHQHHWIIPCHFMIFHVISISNNHNKIIY